MAVRGRPQRHPAPPGPGKLGVQAVVDALFAVDAEATKIFVETRNPTDERVIDYLEAIYVPEELDRQLNQWFKSLARGLTSCSLER